MKSPCGIAVSLPKTFPYRYLLPLDTSNFYRYDGSWTSPPCSEVVSWTIFQDIQPISRAQVSVRPLDHQNCRIGQTVIICNLVLRIYGISYPMTISMIFWRFRPMMMMIAILTFLLSSSKAASSTRETYTHIDISPFFWNFPPHWYIYSVYESFGLNELSLNSEFTMKFSLQTKYSKKKNWNEKLAIFHLLTIYASVPGG